MTALTPLPLVKNGGKVYGVPFPWGQNPLLYDKTAFKTVPDSWSILWDPNLHGKVSVWDDLSTVYMAAQVLGFDKPRSQRPLESDRCSIGTSEGEAARFKAEHSQNVDHWRRTDKSV